MKVGLIGHGYWGKIVEKYLVDDKDIELKYVFDVNELDHPLYINDYEKVLSDKSVDTVFICTPISTHFKLCEQALTNGKNVFCEKPTVRKKKELETLYTLAQNNKRILYTDYIYTVSPTINFIKNNIANIGNLISISGRIEQFDTSYPHDNVYDVLGVHLLSAIYYITRVKATNIEFRDLYKTNNVQAGTIYYTLKDGIKVELFCSLIGCGKERKIQFIGSSGIIEFSLNTSPNYKMKQWRINNGRIYVLSEASFEFNENDGLARAIDEFKYLVSESVLESNFDTAFEVTGFLQEYIESSRDDDK